MSKKTCDSDPSEVKIDVHNVTKYGIMLGVRVRTRAVADDGLASDAGLWRFSPGAGGSWS